MNTLTTTTLRLTAAAALVLTTTLAGAGAGSASEHQPASNPAEDYVAMLLAKHEAAEPYSQADDYVDTLVYWSHHPRWGFGS